MYRFQLKGALFLHFTVRISSIIRNLSKKKATFKQLSCDFPARSNRLSSNFLMTSNQVFLTLCYRYALMTKQSAETVQIKTVLQLLVREGVTACVRRHSDLGIDTDSIRRLLHENSDCFFCQTPPVLAEKNIIIFTVPGCKIFFSCAQILVKEFADRRVFRHNTFFPAFAVDHKIRVLDLVELHSR